MKKGRVRRQDGRTTATHTHTHTEVGGKESERRTHAGGRPVLRLPAFPYLFVRGGRAGGRAGGEARRRNHLYIHTIHTHTHTQSLAALAAACAQPKRGRACCGPALSLSLCVCVCVCVGFGVCVFARLSLGACVRAGVCRWRQGGGTSEGRKKQDKKTDKPRPAPAASAAALLRCVLRSSFSFAQQQKFSQADRPANSPPRESSRFLPIQSTKHDPRARRRLLSHTPALLTYLYTRSPNLAGP